MTLQKHISDSMDQDDSSQQPHAGQLSSHQAGSSSQQQQSAADQTAQQLAISKSKQFNPSNNNSLSRFKVQVTPILCHL